MERHMSATIKLRELLDGDLAAGNLSDSEYEAMLAHVERSEPRKIIIEYFVRNSYGRNIEYILDAGQRQIVQNLTRQKTIDSVIRELLRDLTGGAIIWKQVIAP